jgi:hypothetical protein
MSVSQDFFKEDPLNGVVESADWSPEAQAILMDDVVAHPENRIFQWCQNLGKFFFHSRDAVRVCS